MSGHSKWSKIKRQKGAADQARGNMFSKIARLITVAAKRGGDPDMNAELASAIEKAKSINMPNDTIDRAIKKGTGEDEFAEQIEEFRMAALGDGGVVLLVDCMSDNKRRTIPEITKILETSGWNMAENRSVSWQFEARGLVAVEVPPDELESFELSMIETEGVLDVKREEGYVEVLTEPKQVSGVANHIKQDLNYKVDSFEIVHIPKTPLKVEGEVKQKAEGIIEKLEDHEDVQSVWTNVSL